MDQAPVPRPAQGPDRDIGCSRLLPSLETATPVAVRRVIRGRWEAARVMTPVSEAGAPPSAATPARVPGSGRAHPAPPKVEDVGGPVVSVPPRIATAVEGAVLWEAVKTVAAGTVVTAVAPRAPAGRATAVAAAPEPPIPRARRRTTGRRNTGWVNVVLRRIPAETRAPRHSGPAIEVAVTAPHLLPSPVRVGAPTPPTDNYFMRYDGWGTLLWDVRQLRRPVLAQSDLLRLHE